MKTSLSSDVFLYYKFCKLNIFLYLCTMIRIESKRIQGFGKGAKYKIGDVVKCLPGYSNEDVNFDNYGGLGYKDGAVYTINYIITNDFQKRIVYFFEEIEDMGVFEFALISYKQIREDKLNNILCG